jgi:hypothetical protein
VIGRYPLLHRHVTEHRCLLILFAAHNNFLKQLPVQKK